MWGAKMYSDEKTPIHFLNFYRLLLWGFVMILSGVLVGCAGSASTTQNDSGQLQLGKALHTMKMLNVVPLPIPSGGTLEVERRPVPLGLTLTVYDTEGDYYRYYGMEMGTYLPAGASQPMVDSYRKQVTETLPDEIANFLSKTGFFRDIKRAPIHKKAETDLVLNIVLRRFETRNTSTSGTYEKGFLKYKRATSSIAQGEIDGTLRVATHDGRNLFELPLALKSDPIKKFSESDLVSGAGTPVQIDKESLYHHEKIVRKMFSRLYERLLKKEVELAAIAGPSMAPVAASGRMVGPVAHRYAVIVGLSRYKYASRELPALQYADGDARAMADFLMSPAGGGFDPVNIKLLLNESATYVNVRSALFEFLKDATDNDLVVIYFAGHGLPDPRKLSNLYLVCYDTDPSHIPSTGLPMRDIYAALENHIESNRIVVLADACHSAGIADPKGARGVRGVAINAALSGLSSIKPTCAIFTSSEGYELSQEDQRWGGGHGVFTWALLQGMKGKADGYMGMPFDGRVTLGELVEYTRDVVRRETRNAQHPYISGTFDRDLPMSTTK